MLTMAIIGYGGMGGWHHENIRERLPEIKVKGAFDIRPEMQEKAKANGLIAYESLDALLGDPEIQLVTVATPNDSHRPLVIRCMEAGKHVVCEKPVALNAAELEEMIAASRRTGMLFSIHQNRRWDRDFKIVQKAIADGQIGKPYFIESRVQGSRGAMHGWRGYKLNGGGMLLDWGVHLVDQLLHMIDSPVVSVDAQLLSLFTEQVDDNIKLMLRFENGTCALLEMATNCFIVQPRWHVSCTEGTLVVQDWDCEGRMVKLGESGEMGWEDDIVYTAAGPTRTMAPRPEHTTRQLPLPDVQTDWSDYYRNILEAPDDRSKLLVKPEQALRVMRLIDLAFESQRDGVGKSCHI